MDAPLQSNACWATLVSNAKSLVEKLLTMCLHARAFIYNLDQGSKMLLLKQKKTQKNSHLNGTYSEIIELSGIITGEPLASFKPTALAVWGTENLSCGRAERQGCCGLKVTSAWRNRFSLL